eukprot:scaffold18728_cov121-Isochrysis_galbana.AAC.5
MAACAPARLGPPHGGPRPTRTRAWTMLCLELQAQLFLPFIGWSVAVRAISTQHARPPSRQPVHLYGARRHIPQISTS